MSTNSNVPLQKEGNYKAPYNQVTAHAKYKHFRNTLLNDTVNNKNLHTLHIFSRSRPFHTVGAIMGKVCVTHVSLTIYFCFKSLEFRAWGANGHRARAVGKTDHILLAARVPPMRLKLIPRS